MVTGSSELVVPVPVQEPHGVGNLVVEVDNLKKANHSAEAVADDHNAVET